MICEINFSCTQYASSFTKPETTTLKTQFTARHSSRIDRGATGRDAVRSNVQCSAQFRFVSDSLHILVQSIYRHAHSYSTSYHFRPPSSFPLL